MATKFLPRPLFVLTLLSLIFSTAVFALTLLNYGIFSTWIGAGCAMATIVYHAVVCIASLRYLHKGSPPAAPPKYYSTARVAWIYVLLAMWIVVLGLIVQTTIGGPGSLIASEVNAPYDASIQFGECALISLQTVNMGILAVHSTIAKGRLNRDKRARAEEELFDGEGALERKASNSSQRQDVV